MENIGLYDLKCINVIKDGAYCFNISYNSYLRSYVAERWRGERRSCKKNTIFGFWHTKTTVIEPTYQFKSITEFEFPNNIEDAKIIHTKYIEYI